MSMLRNGKNKISKTKIGAALISAAGILTAIGQTPGVSVAAMPWLQVAAICLGSIGTAIGGAGLRDALDK